MVIRSIVGKNDNTNDLACDNNNMENINNTSSGLEARLLSYVTN